MATLPAFFLRCLDVIYLLYGLALFTMGVVVWLEASRPTSFPLARPLPFLALFGILHGFHEWGEWFVPIHQASHPIPLLADLTLLALAFFLLAEFGYRARIRNHGHSCFLCEIVIRSQFHTTYEPEA
jgi:hypothetical protein